MEILMFGATALGFSLTAEQIEHFGIFSRLLRDWNRRVNLTSITDPDDIQRKHFLDSLACCLGLEKEEPGFSPADWAQKRFIDVGTGAGFPGLPLKIALPEIRLTLLEATGKKIVFLEALVSELGLRGVEVVSGRAEEVAHQPGYRATYDVALARAVAPMATLVELALPFLRTGGVLVAQKGEDPRQEVSDAAYANQAMGGGPPVVTAVNVPGLGASRHLVRIEKSAPTPQAYPRRPGMPNKRPLTRS